MTGMRRGMNYIMKHRILLLIIIILFTFFTGCDESTFDGTRTSNDSQFIVDYSLLNDTKTHEMSIEKDALIDVKIESESGRVDIIIADIEGNVIYKGNDADSGQFNITIPITNIYKFSVTGSNAKGSISFEVVEKANNL